MEKIMNDLDPGRATQSRELQDDELDAVSGGLYVSPIIAILVGVVHEVKSVLETLTK
jgi:hypothetical protein